MLCTLGSQSSLGLLRGIHFLFVLYVWVGFTRSQCSPFSSLLLVFRGQLARLLVQFLLIDCPQLQPSLSEALTELYSKIR